MAEQNITLPVTPNSTDSSGVYSRRGSTGKIASSKGVEKVLPNYLRASTGSCHDFCKFGKKHDTEKERRPFLRRGIRKPPDDYDDSDIQIFVPSKVRTEKNKGLLLSKSADSNSGVLVDALSRRKTSLPGMLRKSVDTKVSRLHESSSGKNEVSANQRLTGSLVGKVSGLIDTSSKLRITSSREKKKSPPTILRTLPDPETRLAAKAITKRMSISQAKLDNPSNQASPSAEVMSLSEKLGSSLKLKSNNAGRVSARSITDLGTGQKSSVPKVALRKLQTSPKVLLSPRRNVAGAARALGSPRVSLSPKSSLTGVAGLNSTKNRGGKVISTLKNGSKIKRTENEQAKAVNNIKKVASKVQPKIQDKFKKEVANKQRMKEVEEVQEKTLYVIKMDTEDKHLESDLNERLDGETSPPPLGSSVKPLSLPECSSSSSLTNEDEEESEYCLTDDEDGSASVEQDSLDVDEQKRWSRRKGVVSSEGQDDPQPVKLRFRRGKVIEIKSENEGPRRLKFRKRRYLGKDQTLKVESRVSYQDRGDEGEVKRSEGDSEKVVLRHQDVDGKKDGQGLFNNVIEETASKLAETRKSKVKALVGAFETVISLQDGKPSTL
ncbi:hypothetical protein LINPERHAP2_LOCUS24797 [Linum perenne]